jgi:hypothetical protein
MKLALEYSSIVEIVQKAENKKLRDEWCTIKSAEEHEVYNLWHNSIMKRYNKKY